MRPNELAAIRTQAVRTLAAVDPHRLWLTIADQRAGYPTGGYDPIGGGSTTSSTEAAALTPDRAAAALHDLEHTMAALRRAVADLDRMWTMWTAPPRKALCDHCGQPTGDRAKTHCRRCTEHVARHGRLPTMAELVAPAEAGRRGGHARAEALTPERRSEIARQAAAARWQGRLVG